MKNKLVIFLFLIVIIPVGSQVLSTQVDNTNSDKTIPVDDKVSTLSLDEFLKKAAAHTDFEKILTEKFLIGYDKVFSVSASQLFLSLKSGYNLNYPFTSDLSHGYDGEFSLKGLFPQSGTSFSAGINLSPSSDYEGSTSVFATLTQSIAKDAFGKVYLLEKESAELNYEIAQIQIIEAYEDYFASVVGLYLQWYLDYQKFVTGQRSYESSSKLLDIIRDKERYRIADQNDVNKTMLQLLSKEASLITLERKFKESRVLVAEAASITDFSNLIPVLGSEEDSSLKLKDINYLQEFHENSRTYRGFNLLSESSILEKEIAARDLLPSAEMYMNFSYNGDKYMFLGESNSLNFTIGVNLDYDFLSIHNKAKAKKADVNVEITALDINGKKSGLNASLQNLLDEIDSINRLKKIAAKEYSIAQEVLEHENERYSEGQIDLNFLIQALNQVDSAEAKLVSYDVQYRQLAVEFLRLSDRLVQNSILD